MFEHFKFGSSKKPAEKPQNEKKLYNESTSSYEVQEVTSPFSADSTGPLDNEPKRTLSVAFADVFRRPSDTSARSSSPERKGSDSSNSGGRKMSFWHSMNPDRPDPDCEPPRNASIHSQNSISNNESADLKVKYVPRNAKGSFLKSASVLTPEERAKRVEEMNEQRRKQSISGVAASRNASLALSDSSDTSDMSGGRRASGVSHDNLATRYNSSRQNSAKSNVKAIPLAADQYERWQNSVSKSKIVNQLNIRPGDALERHRMQSLGGIADIAEGADEPEDDEPPSRSQSDPYSAAPIVAVTKPTPPPSMRRKQSGFTVDAKEVDDDDDHPRTSRSKVDSAFGHGDLSSRTMTWTQIHAITGPDSSGRTSGPQNLSENEALEKLGFRGAIPT